MTFNNVTCDPCSDLKLQCLPLEKSCHLSWLWSPTLFSITTTNMASSMHMKLSQSPAELSRSLLSLFRHERFSQGQAGLSCAPWHIKPALVKAKTERAVGTGDLRHQPPSYYTKYHSWGPGETNNQFMSQQLALAISLHDLPWLSLVLRMRSLKEETMEETSVGQQ